MARKNIRITHRPSGTVLADGLKGWPITPFEGNYYISSKALSTDGFKVNFIPGLCLHKFLYVWLDFKDADGRVAKNLGWKYWLPNPIFPFIWFRVGVPGYHPDIDIEEYVKK